MKQRLITVLCGSIALVGCGSLDNPCNDQGVGQCASVTTAYNNSLKDTPSPADFPRGTSSKSSSSSSTDSDLVSAYNKQQSYSQLPTAGKALRTTPQSMRIWILPYEDELGIYHDQQYVYALVYRGEWKYKSTSLKSSTNQYVTTYADNVTSSKYQPFMAKESDPINSNQNLISTLGNPGSTNSTGQANNPFSMDSVANKNNAILNSISSPSAATSSAGN